MLPAWLMPGAPPEAAPSRLVGAPRLMASSRVGNDGPGCTALVTWRLRSVAHIEGRDGELTLAQLTNLTECSGDRIGSCLAKLRAKGWVVPASGNRGKAYRWVGPR